MTPDSLSPLDGLCDQLARLASALEAPGAWPGEQLALLGRSGVLRWFVPVEHGGAVVSPSDLLAAYVWLSEACLVTAFVLTQRSGACQRITLAQCETLRRELLPPLARGDRFATVGISHLTTSRRHLGRPAVSIEPAADGYLLDGEVPWVTGAAFAQDVVTGGVFSDGRQALLAVPMDAKGVSVASPARLLALNASQTASVSLERVFVPRDRLLAGPAENVMQGAGGTGSLTTSALAIGSAGSALGHLAVEADRRSDLAPILASLERERDTLLADLLAAASPDGPAPSAESIRKRANSLALRASQALLAASKGAGFVCGHPAERAVREAMFFLVWSCPQAVVAAALRDFACESLGS